MEAIWFEECGRRRQGEKAICKQCGQSFIRRLNGNKKYCSRACVYKTKQNRIEITCSGCGKKDKRTPSKLLRSKSGLFFCSRKCKDSSQRIESGLTEIWPDHYGSSTSYHSYKRSELNGGCVDCGEKRKYLLDTHHIDGNRANCIDENLEIVCANCHRRRHLKFNDGKWVFSTKSITPRNVLKSV